MQRTNGISLRQILERARSRAEKRQFDKCPRIRFHQSGYGDAGNGWLKMEFRRDGVWVSYSPWSMALPHVHDASGYIPRDVVDHADEVSSGEDLAAQWTIMRNLSPTAPFKFLNALTELWQPWVLKDLDLLEV